MIAFISLPSLLGIHSAHGQRLDVTLLEAHSQTPIPGAMVALIDSSGLVRSRAVTSTRGTAHLRAPHTGTWRLLVERIGYETAISELVTLAEGEESAIELRRNIEPIELAKIRVEFDATCHPDRSGVRPAAIIWNEARKALERVVWTRLSGVYEFDVELYDQRLGRDRRIQREETERLTVRSFNPFATAPPELLSETGFIHAQDHDTLYFGPDADVLLSDAFARTHCFHSLRDQDTERIGLAFEPLDTEASDIAGVLWLDQETAALLAIDFRYTGPIAGAVDRAHEGHVSFRQLPDGGWIIERWWIRLPLFRRPLVWHDRTMRISGARRQLRFSGYRERGGFVHRMRTITPADSIGL